MKNPGAKRRGAWEGTWADCPTGSSPVPVIPDWNGEERMCFVAGPCGPSPARNPPDRPPLTPWRFATSRGLPPALRRGGGFQALLTVRPRSLLIARMAAVLDGYVRTDSDSPDSLYVPTSTGRSSSSSGIELQSELVTRMVLPSGSFSP